MCNFIRAIFRFVVLSAISIVVMPVWFICDSLDRVFNYLSGFFYNCGERALTIATNIADFLLREK